MSGLPKSQVIRQCPKVWWGVPLVFPFDSSFFFFFWKFFSTSRACSISLGDLVQQSTEARESLSVGGAVEAKASVDHCPFHVLESLLSCFIQSVEVFRNLGVKESSQFYEVLLEFFLADSREGTFFAELPQDLLGLALACAISRYRWREEKNRQN